MSFLQISFYVFLVALLVAYYLLPKKMQWVCLLIGSYIFYLNTGINTIGFILITTITIWAGALMIEKEEEKKRNALKIGKEVLSTEEKKKLKVQTKKKQRWIFWSILVFNFGILAFLKYFNFASENISDLISLITGKEIEPLQLGLLLPLGISFYTFQSVGYLVDVANGKYKAEKNLFRFALFVSFFPQIIQGPIGRYDKLSEQLHAERKFDIDRIKNALVLMLWGFFKKLIIADRAIVIVSQVFDNYNDYGGAMTVIGVLFYSLQQYADFSGGIDVATGVAELFGIQLAPNFMRPYFSKSLSEFWRRWHISLGAWMRDYVFYPIALTKGVNKMGKFMGKKFGKHIGKVMPVAFANIVVFLIVGIWHGPYWHYVAWGLYNGVILAVSALLEPVYIWMKKLFKVKEESFGYSVFQIARTFFIVNLGWYFDRGNGLIASVKMLKNTVTNFNMSQVNKEMLLGLGLEGSDFIILAIATIILFIVSVLQERNIKIREALFRRNIIIRWVILYALIFGVLMFPANSSDLLGGFMYAQF